MTDRSMTKLMLTGMTDRSAEELLPLAKSWYNAPAIKGLEAAYDQVQRAFVLKPAVGTNSLEFTIAASSDSPVLNPAFVIRDWVAKNISLTVDGKNVPRGKDFRYGVSNRIDGADLVIWFKHDAAAPVSVKISHRD